MPFKDFISDKVPLPVIDFPVKIPKVVTGDTPWENVPIGTRVVWYDGLGHEQGPYAYEPNENAHYGVLSRVFDREVVPIGIIPDEEEVDEPWLFETNEVFIVPDTPIAPYGWTIV